MTSHEVLARTVTMPARVRDASAGSQGGAGSQLVLGDEGVALRLGAHPVAKELASLGLPSPAVLSTWTEKMTATFGEARPL